AARELDPITNADTILRVVLLAELGLQESDLQVEGRTAPRAELVISPLQRLDKTELFESRLSRARAAFKGVVDHPLLKTWGFTLASFADVKAQFSSWNLYVCLGLDPHQPGGIGQALLGGLQGRIDRLNAELEELNARYEVVYSMVRQLESRMEQSSEAELRWL